MQDIADFLITNPIVLFPMLIVGAIITLALLKKLLKMAAVLAIAGVLYVLLVEYFGPGF